MPIEEIFQTMKELVAEQFAVEPAGLTMDTTFEEDLGAELGCHFCHSQYAFSTQDLKDLLERASRE